ncbi:hypothetical protein Tco_1032910 [Tanacetum coccineum]|uniref:Uncharacterized protein n=1 Tax=Tanacetum coccineum TaxID=301880 RepID=A0ABQ5GEU5_9ASTR
MWDDVWYGDSILRIVQSEVGSSQGDGSRRHGEISRGVNGITDEGAALERGRVSWQFGEWYRWHKHTMRGVAARVMRWTMEVDMDSDVRVA